MAWEDGDNEAWSQRWVDLSQEEPRGSDSQEAGMVKPQRHLDLSVTGYSGRGKNSSVTPLVVGSGEA